MNNYGEIIRRKRKESGHTQRSLARVIGKDHTYISKLENGHLEDVKPSVATLLAIGQEIGLGDYILDIAGKLRHSELQDRASESPLYAGVINRLATGVSHQKWLEIHAILSKVEDQS